MTIGATDLGFSLAASRYSRSASAVLIREMEENGKAVVRIEEIRLDSNCRFKVFPRRRAVPFAPLGDSLLIFLDSRLRILSGYLRDIDHRRIVSVTSIKKERRIALCTGRG